MVLKIPQHQNIDFLGEIGPHHSPLTDEECKNLFKQVSELTSSFKLKYDGKVFTIDGEPEHLQVDKKD